MPAVTTALSVIIVTCNRLPQLTACLRYLHPQLKAADEVIVVDASPRADRRVAEVCHGSKGTWLYVDFTAQSDQVRLAAARNLGLTRATNRRVLCLDDDCLAGTKMLSRHRTGNPLVAIYGVRTHIKANPKIVSAAVPMTHKGERDERYALSIGPYAKSQQLLLQNKYGSIPYEAAWGFQFSFPRAAALSIGGFNEEFQTYGGDDQEFAGRLQQLGLFTDLDPQAHCYHFTQPSVKNTWKQQVVQSLERPSPVRNGGPLGLVSCS